MAAPFVEGRLRDETLAVDIHTQCGHCAQKLTLSVDSDLRYRVHESDARPLVFEPRLDWSRFREPNIIGQY